MTHTHDDHALSSSAASGPHEDPSSLADAERIAAELAALGEDPVDDDELAFATTVADGLSHEDVRTVATLVALSRWEPSARELLPLERQRVWRRVAEHAPAPVADPSQTAANGWAGWRGVVAGLALVAGLAVVPRFDVAAPASQEQRAATQELGEAARLGIEVFGDKDGARASSLADDYEARLRAARGGDAG